MTQTIERQSALLDLKAHTDADLISAVRNGLYAETIVNLSHRGYHLRFIVEIVGPRSTIHRKIKGGSRLGAHESDRLSRLVRVVAIAEKAFGSEEKAQKWLQRPSRQLAGEEAPIKLLDTDQGAHLVEARLMQIGHGMFG